MRNRLSRYSGECRVFRAKVHSNRYRQRGTVLLTELLLADDREKLAHHVWLQGEDALLVAKSEGTRIRFKARVRRYQRRDGSVDYGLSRVRDVQIVQL